MKRLLFISGILSTFLSCSLPAWSRAYNGVGPGDSTIGTGGDYATLLAAANAFNSTPLTGGDWTFRVLNNLNETQASIFNQQTNGNHVTLRPAVGQTPTITFPDDLSISGLTIGSRFGGVPNFVIDGSDGVGPTTRSLTLIGASSALSNLDVVSIFSNSNGSGVRNCVLVDHWLGSGNFISACVAFIRYEANDPGHAGSNCFVENCQLINNDNPAGQGVVSWGNLSALSGNVGMENLVIRNNDMNVRARGAWFHNVRSGVIENNKISVNQTDPAYSAFGILLNDLSNGVDGLDITIRNNHFTRINGAHHFTSVGTAGLSIGNSGSNAVYRIYNNMFGGIKESAGATTAGALQGICISKAGNAQIFVKYNSIDVLPPDSPVSGLTRDNCFGIGGTDATFTGTVLTTNNIVRMGASYGCVLSIPVTEGTWTSDYNDLYPADPGAVTGRYGGADYATLAQWKTTKHDIHSVAIDPLVGHPPAAGKWISSTDVASDLHFSSKPGAGYYASPDTSITQDMDGDSRDSIQPTMGADESKYWLLDEDFTSISGWSPFLADNLSGTSADYDSTGSALRGTVTSGAGYRIGGWISFGPASQIPYGAVGTGNFVRGKFYIYAGGQATSAANEIPNLRLRLANRFAVTSLLQVLHHSSVDPEGANLAQDFRPSTIPTSPSLYRVDLDPVDVPILATRGATEGILRAFEAYSNEPQDNGYIALAESTISTYPALADSTSPAVLLKVYQPGISDPGDFASTITTAERFDYNFVPDTNAPMPTLASGPFGVTLDTTNIPSDRIGIAAVDFPTGAVADSNFALRVRVEEGKQYKIRFHATSTQLSNRNSEIRFRARSIKWQWAHNLELGGAGAASVANNDIASQALPGVGCQNPESSGENGGWYSLLFQSPMNKEIRSDFPPGTSLATSMPHISKQDPPGVDTGLGNTHSRRDIMFGVDVIDTFDKSSSAGYTESGNVTLDRIEVRAYSQVPD